MRYGMTLGPSTCHAAPSSFRMSSESFPVGLSNPKTLKLLPIPLRLRQRWLSKVQFTDGSKASGLIRNTSLVWLWNGIALEAPGCFLLTRLV